MEMVKKVRKKGAQASTIAAKRSIDRHAAKVPPAVYKVGDEVLVQAANKKWNKVKAKGVTVPRSYTGKVLEVNMKINKYKVSVDIDGTNEEQWVEVSKITSVTRGQEKKRVKNIAIRNSPVSVNTYHECLCTSIHACLIL